MLRLQHKFEVLVDLFGWLSRIHKRFCKIPLPKKHDRVGPVLEQFLKDRGLFELMRHDADDCLPSPGQLGKRSRTVRGFDRGLEYRMTDRESELLPDRRSADFPIRWRVQGLVLEQLGRFAGRHHLAPRDAAEQHPDRKANDSPVTGDPDHANAPVEKFPPALKSASFN